jgi:hypothetical protein
VLTKVLQLAPRSRVLLEEAMDRIKIFPDFYIT